MSAADETERLGAAVIGYGYWGPNLARNILESSSFKLLHICDQDQERREMARRRYPAVSTPATSDAVMSDARVNAVFIATPTVSHYPLAMRFGEAECLHRSPLRAVARRRVASQERGDRGLF
jgi:predicted dehydrogenase